MSVIMEDNQEDNPKVVVDQNDNSDDKQHEYPLQLQNSDVLANLEEQLGHFFQKTCSVIF